jgi:dipeptidyl aminopeptidase/acylaminoacyl peptidase
MFVRSHSRSSLRHAIASAFAACLVATAGTTLAQSPASIGPAPGGGSKYLVPPEEIVKILDAPDPPAAVVSPARDIVALEETTNMPPIAELAQPMLRLAGLRINPSTNGPHRTPGVVAVTFKPVAGGKETRVTVPGSAGLATIGFSPSGRHFALAVFEQDRITLRLVNPATGRVAAVDGLRINGLFSAGAFGRGACEWADDSSALYCPAVPARRGAAPAAPAVPSGPDIQQTSGRGAPVPTFQDLLRSEHDEALFEYYGTSQIVRVDPVTLTVTTVGEPGLYASFSPSPDGKYLLVERVVRPFSWLLPYSRFPCHVEVWAAGGQLVKRVAEVPTADAVPVNGVITGPRSIEWQASAPAVLVWAEALDKGDPKNKVPHRDRVMSLAAPFTAQPSEVVKTEWRFRGLSYTERGVGLLTESDRPTRRVRTWLLEANVAPRAIFERSSEDRYGDPGTPLRRPGSSAVMQVSGAIYLSGQGASPEGDRPFLDRYDLATGRTERLFHCDATSYETVAGLLDDQAERLVTRRESRTEPPNVMLLDRAKGTRAPLTDFEDPAPQLTGVTREVLSYERPDGVKLSATLLLPPGRRPGEKLPMLFWAYPQEFADAGAAGQVSGSKHRFITINGPSHLLLLTQGYAILDNPTMPIVGPGETANDSYVEQLVASAKAAVDKVVAMGVADPDRIGVGGHSYGAFMTANLLAHSDLFRAGIARSGAYNRSLTPFGFQAETRTFWEVPELYARMSPFWYAPTVNEPILLTHGAADNNSGTFPVQSERFYAALKANGATARYVVLPHEAHGYAARESVLHTVAEMLNWMDTYVKNAKPRGAATSASAR